MGLYRLIPKDRYITREELVRESGMGDRMVRREINELRKHPETVIISSSKHRGYKRPSSAEEIELCLNESRSRVAEEREKQRVLEGALLLFRGRKAPEQGEFDF